MKEQHKKFLHSNYEKIDLKYIFDHLRNVGISSAVIYAGVILIKNSNNETLRILKFLDPAYIGIAIIILGSLLALANYFQLIYLSNPKSEKLKFSLPAALALPVYCITGYLIAAYIFQQS